MINTSTDIHEKNYQLSRIIWLDTLRGFAIFLVVFGHFILRLKCGGYILVLISSFHMPLFFVLSGYNLKNANSKFILQNIRKLYVPYLWFCSSFLVYQIISNASKRTLGDWMINITSIKTILHTLLMTHKSIFSNFWFLPTLFTVELIFFCCQKKVQNIYKIFGISIFVSIVYAFCVQGKSIATPIGSGEAILAFPFICFGIILKNKKHDGYNRMKIIVSVITFILIHICIKISNFPIISMYNSQIGNIIVFLLIGFSSCYLLFAFFSRNHICNISNPISCWGRNSLWIYGLHYIIMEIILDIHNKCFLIYNIWILLILSFIYTYISIVFCISIKNIFLKLKVYMKDNMN